MEFINLREQYKRLQGRIDQRIKTVLDHGKYILGPEVGELEVQLANFVGVEYGVGVANGTDALHLSLLALGVGPGDVVITTPFTFFATVEVIELVGAQPLLVDIDPATYNICPKLLEEALKLATARGESVKAAIAVDLFGLPANYQEIVEIVNRYGVKLIEDAAQGLGGAIRDRKAGSFGCVSTTSFFPAKPLGGYGDGGMVFTNDPVISDVVKSLRVHGKGKDKYDNVRIGLNSRLDTIQAAILLEKLAVFEEELRFRNIVASRYQERLSQVQGLVLPFVPEGYNSAWAQFTIRSENRDELKRQLQELGIPTSIYYPKPMHKLAALQYRGFGENEFPESEKASEQVLSLPMHPYLTEEEQDKVVSAIISSC